MTFKEKLMMEHPEDISDYYDDGFAHCPQYYDYEDSSPCLLVDENCSRCWNREMSETSSSIIETDYDYIVSKDVYNNLIKENERLRKELDMMNETLICHINNSPHAGDKNPI